MALDPEAGAQIRGLSRSGYPLPVGWFMWLPMLVFEVALALWLLIKGVAILERG
jgi:hypothetical protein